MTDGSEESKKSGMTQVTLMKWLLTSSSHLGRALAELFGLLVNQCIGSDHTSRLRRHGQNGNQSAVPTIKSRAIATLLTKLLMKGLSWKCPDTIKVPRLRYSIFSNICANISNRSQNFLVHNSVNSLYLKYLNPYMSLRHLFFIWSFVH